MTTQAQTTFGQKLAYRAYRCWKLTAAVPEEHEEVLWKQGDELVRAAALFGDEESEQHVRNEERRAADRASWQRSFWELSAGF